MSKSLDELLFSIRQHPAFQELLSSLDPPGAKHYRPGEDPQMQYAEFIFRSGRRLQHESWRQFLIGDTASQQESIDERRPRQAARG